MSKLNVNDKVMSLATGEIGTVRARNIIVEDNSAIVEYMVDFGGSMASWKVMEKSMLKRVPKENRNRKDAVVAMYDLGGGKKLTMVGIVEPKYYVMGYGEDEPWESSVTKGRQVRIGFSIYNGKDEFNEQTGLKIARHRAKKNPFCQMSSTFACEFNDATVRAIMGAKAEYIKEHIGEFFRPR